jgi:hypothetical protein
MEQELRADITAAGCVHALLSLCAMPDCRYTPTTIYYIYSVQYYYTCADPFGVCNFFFSSCRTMLPCSTLAQEEAAGALLWLANEEDAKGELCRRNAANTFATLLSNVQALSAFREP